MKSPKKLLFGTANADHQIEAHHPEREDLWELQEHTQILKKRGNTVKFPNRFQKTISPPLQTSIAPAAALISCKLFRLPPIYWQRAEPECGKNHPQPIAHLPPAS